MPFFTLKAKGTASGVNVRDKPAGAVIGGIRSGTIIEVSDVRQTARLDDETYTWSQVWWGDKTGYIAREVVELVPGAAPPLTPQPIPRPEVLLTAEEKRNLATLLRWLADVLEHD